MQKIVQRYINSEKCFYFTPANLRNTDFTLTETAYNEKNTWGWPASWTDIDKLSTKRIEVTETGENAKKVYYRSHFCLIYEIICIFAEVKNTYKLL